ncbi:internal scaffolding protein [Blackfly microvirus SF02]|uniref:Internal scaffolding protein n=1 Tax=Blackfly microvirus SF02 TaxID=2576452 RepID=A0A4P8PQH9_9VIRU|nr:internal scaffolding protein [Blackfly microvirus SF02]
MNPALRSQADDLGDAYSNITALTFQGEESLTRQEFAEETDINYILRRHGASEQRIANYGGEVDYNLDLQQALSARDAATRANIQVPEEIRHKYPDWVSVLRGADNGEYQRDLQQLADKQHAAKLKTDEATAMQEAKARIQRDQVAAKQILRDLEDRRTPEERSE